MRAITLSPPALGSPSTKHLEAVGAITGALGTALISFSAALAFYTFCSYAVSNAAWIWYATRVKAAWLFGMNAFYTAFTVNGLINHFPW